VGDVVELARDDARKLTLVLRRSEGSALEVVDSSGGLFAATLLPAASGASARLEAALARPPAPRLALTLAQGVPKGQKMDFVVEKATELGVARIVPFYSERGASDSTREGKVERWRRIARSAAQQCGRLDVPDVAAPLDFAALCGTFAAYGRALVPWELADPVPLREALPPLVAGLASLVVVVGPEGGLAHAETAAATAAGAVLISLGRRILRTETAGLVACTAALYASGDI
jgi:16S rRNA (uracil1498-N3)-methyltransferase